MVSCSRATLYHYRIWSANLSRRTMVHCKLLQLNPNHRLANESKMNRDIERGKCSILGNQEWSVLPWRNFTKDSLQELFDIGFMLAAVLEEVDLCESGDTSVIRLESLSSGCQGVRQRFHVWYNDYSAIGIGPELDSVQYENPAQLRFTSMWDASIAVHYWLFQLIMQDITFRSLQFIPAGASAFDNGYGLTLANNIVMSSSFLLTEDLGWLGPQRLFFPLRRSLEVLAKARSPLVADAQAAFKTLVTRLRGG